jgi:cytochrome P450
VLPSGPRGRPLLGSLPEIRRDPLAFLSRIAAEYGDIVRIRLGPLNAFVLNHPDDIEHVLITHQHRFIKGRTLSRARRLFGNGLLTSDGTLHSRQRRLVQPAFHRARLNEYAAVMAAAAAERRDTWRPGDVIDIAGEMSRLTLTITARLLFGADGDAVAAEIGDALDIVSSHFEVAVLPFAFADLVPLPHARRFRAARQTLDRAMYDLIERRRRDGRERDDVMALLMAARDEGDGETMSDGQLRDELVTLLLASHETTANALGWTWYLLSGHAETADRMHREIDAVLGADRLPAAADVQLLSFTRMVLAESMRLYPPAWLIARVAVEDHDVRGYTIPRGAIVVLSPWIAHRNGIHFPEPDRFEPERWRPERQNERPRFSYFPFGGGSRGCMGEAFAWMEGVILLAVITQRWRFRVVDASRHPEMQPGLTLTPKSGIRVQVEQRL